MEEELDYAMTPNNMRMQEEIEKINELNGS
jgi:hypothetical protein